MHIPIVTALILVGLVSALHAPVAHALPHSASVAYVTDFGTGVSDPTLAGSSIFVNAINGIAIPSGGTYLPTGGVITTFTDVFVSTIDSGGVATLNAYDTVMLYQVCDIGSHPNTMTAINSYLSAGMGKVVIFDADRCAGTGTPNYSGFILPFTTNNPGPLGLAGTITSVESEPAPNTLTSGISLGLVASPIDAVGDANTFNAAATGWCSAVQGTNANGITGNQVAYAHAASSALIGPGGLVIYDGQDNWFTDLGTPTPNAYNKLYFDNILNQPFNPETLPCGHPIAPGVPEFGIPAFLLSALALPVVLLLSRMRIAKRPTI